MKRSIKTMLMEDLGITKDEAMMLIKAYAKNHDGKVNPVQIENDIKRISNSMIFEVGNIYKDYDIKHELTECGKDRTMSAVRSLMDSDETAELARRLSCE